MNRAGRIGVRNPEAIPRAIVGIGVVLIVATVAYHVGFGTLADAGIGQLLIYTVAAVPMLAVVYGGYWLEAGSLPPRRYRRVLAWIVVAGGAWFLVNLVLIVPEIAESTAQGLTGWLLFATKFGVGIGLLVGVVEARAIHRAVEAEAAAVRAERAASERELLTYVNDLLRHEVLNAANVIGGSADLLVEEHDDGRPVDRARLDAIRSKSEELADVVQDVRTLLETTKDQDVDGGVDLAALLDGELRVLRELHDVDVETDVPENVTVRGEAVLGRVFRNLLDNAVEHNDGPRPRIRVTVESGPDVATVHVADDGPGVPESKRDSLFERTPGDHGFGLYLTRLLVRRYGGSIELSETGEEGSVFTVTLPRGQASTGSPAESGSASDAIEEPLQAIHSG